VLVVGDLSVERVDQIVFVERRREHLHDLGDRRSSRGWIKLFAKPLDYVGIGGGGSLRTRKWFTSQNRVPCSFIQQEIIINDSLLKYTIF
jgi:hypothetical protein